MHSQSFQSPTPDCVLRLEATLGEGPVWLASERAVWFVDIKRNLIHRYAIDSHSHHTWTAPAQPSFLAPISAGGFVVGTQGALHRFEPNAGTFTLLLRIEPDRPNNRLNDGYVDRGGRLWFGSMDDAEREPSGALYCMNRELAIVRKDTGYCITNGPTMSPDGKILYHTDTGHRTIYAFDVALDNSLLNKRIFARIEADDASLPGYFDGSITDAEGCLWTGMFGGARLVRHSPRGELIGRIELPCSHVTKAAFGDSDLRTLYITTARKGLSTTELQSQPLAGSLFAVRLAVPGLPQHVLDLD